MSGPKLSAAEIEVLRQRQIASLRKTNEEVVFNAVRTIRAEAERARGVANRLGRYQENALNSIAKSEERQIAAIMASGTDGYPHDPSRAKTFNDNTRDKAQSVIGAFRQELSDLMQGWDRDYAGVAHLRQIDKVVASFETFTDDSPQTRSCADLIAEVLDEQALSINRLKQLEAEGCINILNDAANSIADIQALILSSAVPVDKKSVLTTVTSKIQDAILLFQADRNMEPQLLNELRSAEPEIISARKCERERKSLYDRCMLCVAQISELTGYERQIPRIEQIATLQDLSELLDTLEEEARSASENAYVAYAIDEVMARHGYDLKKSVQLLPATDQNRRLYMSERSDIGIHAFQGANGMVMMETASISPSVRGGDDDQAVERTVLESSYERARLVQEQVAFCSLFSEVVNDLEEYGINFSVKSDKAPSEENSVAFDSAEAVAQSSPTDTSSAVRRRRRRARHGGSQREVK